MGFHQKVILAVKFSLLLKNENKSDGYFTLV